MNIRACDVCYYQDNKTEVCRYRVGFKRDFKINVCEKHHNFLDKLPLEVAREKYYTLMMGKFSSQQGELSNE